MFGDLSLISNIATVIKFIKGSNDTEVQYVSNINHFKFYQFCIIPAVVLTLLMAATKSRRHKLLSFLAGRPGLVFPMDTLTRSSRISYCCAFGATCMVITQIITTGKFAIDYDGPLALKTLIVIVSMFIYGTVFFPVFTSLALESAFSYSLGSVYVWMFFILEVYKVTEYDLDSKNRAVLVVRALPILLCLGYLSVEMPVKFFLLIYKKRYFTPSLGEDLYNETIEQIKKSYQGKHVRKLLLKPEIVRPPEGIVNVIKAAVKDKISYWIYHNQSGFLYPSRLLSVMFVAACVVYVINVEFLVLSVTTLIQMREEIEAALRAVDKDSEDSSIFLILHYISEVFIVSFIVSVCVSCAISFLSILHMMSSFRANLFALYQGDYSHIPPPETKSAVNLCTGSIKYAGFQVAYIVWAYIIITAVLLIISLVLAVVITLLIFGVTDWLVNKILQLWPSLVFGVALLVAHWLLSKYVFLQNNGEHLRLDNRHFYFVFTYFMFFFNIFMGSFSCLLRVIKAMVVGMLFLSRLDNSTLPRKFEFFDPGFSAYQGYIHLEVAHTHPVVNVFIRLLVSMSNSRKMDESKDKEIEMCHVKVQLNPDNSLEESSTDCPISRPINAKARFNWLVTYTLLQNPTVRIYRKGFIQAMKKARKEGLKIPISDQPITDFDLVKAQAEKDEHIQEEKNKMNTGHGLSDGWGAVASMMGSPERKILKEREPKKWQKPSWLKKLTKRQSLTFEDNDSLESSLKNVKV